MGLFFCQLSCRRVRSHFQPDRLTVQARWIAMSVKGRLEVECIGDRSVPSQMIEPLRRHFPIQRSAVFNPPSDIRRMVMPSKPLAPPRHRLAMMAVVGKCGDRLEIVPDRKRARKKRGVFNGAVALRHDQFPPGILSRDRISHGAVDETFACFRRFEYRRHSVKESLNAISSKRFVQYSDGHEGDFRHNVATIQVCSQRERFR